MQVFVDKRIVGDYTRARSSSRFKYFFAKTASYSMDMLATKTLRIHFIVNLTSVRIEPVDVTLHAAGAILAKGFGVSSSTVV
ncbi:hypothetical protein F6X42_11525 [Paraburkholderia sp. WC7.3b]|uniref:Uncharacterized protein n=1 Tax=Paraburkholderia podalyriae TaxID=1938811 RepID=A0ABR7PLM6_9BURK|nr:hypothetical protein [Paraburkholderia podalyriae]